MRDHPRDEVPIRVAVSLDDQPTQLEEKTMTADPIRIAMAAAVTIAVLTSGVRAADVPQIHVRYGDLNVNSSTGAATLLQRIRFAADRVCDFRDTRDLSVLAMVQACTNHAVADAVATVNNPKLTALYEAKMGKIQSTRFAGVR